MIWTNDIAEFLIFNSLNIILLYILWLVLKKFMELLKAYHVIYYSLKANIILFIFPLSICIYYLKFYVEKGTWLGFFKISNFLPNYILTGILYVWLIGMLIKVIMYGAAIRRFHKVLVKSKCINKYDKEVENLKKRVKLKRKINVFENELFTSPAVYGVFKWKLIMPKYAFSEKETELILAHEILHLKHHDLFIKRLLSAVNIIFWFHPLIYCYMAEYDCWSEIICDYNVYNAIRYNKKFYAQLLFNIASIQNEFRNYNFVFFNKNYKSLKRRVICMKNFKTGGLKTAAVLTGIFFAVSSMTVYAAESSMIDWTNQTGKYEDIIETENFSMTGEEEEFTDLLENVESQIVEMSSDVDLSSVGASDWTVPAKTMYTTKNFYVSKGGTVLVTAKVKQSGVKVNVGILQDGGTRKYIIANKTTHEFKIEMSGNYKVFVENTNSSAVDVSISYIY